MESWGIWGLDEELLGEHAGQIVKLKRVAVFSPFSIATLEYPWWFIKERGLFWLMVGSGNLRSVHGRVLR